VFVVWAAFLGLWTFATLVALNARAAARKGLTVDPEQVVTIVLYVLLCFCIHARILRVSQIRAIFDVHSCHALDALRAHQYEPDDTRALQCEHDEGPREGSAG